MGAAFDCPLSPEPRELRAGEVVYVEALPGATFDPIAVAPRYVEATGLRVSPEFAALANELLTRPSPGAVWREDDEPYTADDLPGTAAMLHDEACRREHVEHLEAENARLTAEVESLRRDKAAPVKGQRDWRQT